MELGECAAGGRRERKQGGGMEGGRREKVEGAIGKDDSSRRSAPLLLSEPLIDRRAIALPTGATIKIDW